MGMWFVCDGKGVDGLRMQVWSGRLVYGEEEGRFDAVEGARVARVHVHVRDGGGIAGLG